MADDVPAHDPPLLPEACALASLLMCGQHLMRLVELLSTHDALTVEIRERCKEEAQTYLLAANAYAVASGATQLAPPAVTKRRNPVRRRKRR